MINITKTYFSATLVRLVLLSILLLLAFGVSKAQVPTSGLVGYYPFNGNTNDESSNLNHATNYGATLTENRFGQIDSAYVFNGVDQYIEIPDADQYSIASTDQLSISVWMRNDVLDFINHENDYVHWIGKGVSSQQEWLLRIYNLNSIRPNRTSCYAFNLSGGLGAGSYVQENVSIGEWIHIVAIYNYQTDTIQLYKNGQLKDSDLFSDYSIIPENGTAPVRIGTRDFGSYYQGAIDDIRFFNRVLTSSEIDALYHEGECVLQNIVSNEMIDLDTTIYAENLIILDNVIVNSPYELTLKSPEVIISTTCEILNGAKLIVINELGCTQN